MAKKKWTKADSGRLMRKAAEVMQDKGYCNGSLQGLDGRMCVRGAVNYTYCGNAQVTGSGAYADRLDDLIKMEEQTRSHNKKIRKGMVSVIEHLKASLRRNEPIYQTLEDFREFLGDSVESFNDSHKGDEVIGMMRKFADEVDPQRV